MFFFGFILLLSLFIGTRDRCDEDMNWDLMDMR